MSHKSIRIYLFHRVSGTRDKMWDPMDPLLFEKVVARLVKKYEVVQLEEYLLNPNAAGKTLKQKAAICFDDGFKDNLLYAAPILKKYGCNPSLYIVTDCITHQLPTWNYEVDYLFNHTKKDSLSFSNEIHNGHIQFSNEVERRKFGRWFKHKLKSVTGTVRKEILAEVRKQIKDVVLPSDIMLSWDEVRMLLANGWYIGSHTLSHPLLAKINDENEIMEEMKQSANIIRQQLGYNPVSISYPMGSYDDNIKAASKQAGYSIGLALGEHSQCVPISDLYEIHRIQLFNESWIKTWMRMNGYIHALKKMINGRRIR